MMEAFLKIVNSFLRVINASLDLTDNEIMLHNKPLRKQQLYLGVLENYWLIVFENPQKKSGRFFFSHKTLDTQESVFPRV